MSARIEILKRYLEEDPSDSFLRYALALEFIALNKSQQAYDQLKKLLDDDPDYLPGYYMAGKTAESCNDLTEAIQWYTKGIELARVQKDMHTLSELQSAKDAIED
jgi:tetratricopeptide (TPR) repeat protein